MSSKGGIGTTFRGNKWVALALLTAVYTLHYIDRSIMGIVLEPIRHEFGFSDKQLGALAGLIFGIAFAIAGIPLGWLVDRVHRVRLLASILAIWSVFTGLGALANSFWAFAAARFAVGAAESGGSPTAMSLLSDIFPPGQRSTAVGTFFLASGIGTIFSFLVGGHIVAVFGWKAALLLAGLPGLMLAPILLLFLPNPERGSSEPVSAHGAAGSFRVNRAALANLFAASILSTGVTAAGWAWAASFFIRIHGFDVKQAGMAVALGAGIFGSLGTLTAGRLGEWLGKRSLRDLLMLPAGTSLAIALVVPLYAFAPVASISVAAFLIFSALGTTYMAPTYAVVLGSLDPGRRGFGFAIIQVLNNLLGAGLAPFLIGMISDWKGGGDSLRYGLAAIAILSLWATVHFLIARHLAPAGRSAGDDGRRPELAN